MDLCDFFHLQFFKPNPFIMKYTEFLLVTGDNLAHALQLMKNEFNEKYADQACKVNNIFILPEGRTTGSLATGPNGMPAVKMVINLVAVIDEEPELEGLQRNYKPAFDFLNTNRDAFLPLIMGWLTTISGSVPPELRTKFFEALNNKPFNE